MSKELATPTTSTPSNSFSVCMSFYLKEKKRKIRIAVSLDLRVPCFQDFSICRESHSCLNAQTLSQERKQQFAPVCLLPFSGEILCTTALRVRPV